MYKTVNFLALVLILTLCAFAYSTSAQEAESTPEATQESPITVIIEAPLENPETGGISNPNTFIKALVLVSLLFNVLQAFWSSKSVSPEMARLVFGGARELAKTTKSPTDDKAVEMLESSYNNLVGLRPTELEEPKRD